MRLYGYDAINYVKSQGGQLNRFPNAAPGVEYGISIEEAEQTAAEYPYRIWTEMGKGVMKNAK